LWVSVGLILVLGFVELIGSPMFGRLRLDAAVFLLVATVFAGTADAGPMVAAASSHWPSPGPARTWVSTLDQQVSGPSRVLCLGLTAAPAEDTASLDAYVCSRWASSLQGKEGLASLTWRFVQLGRQPVSDALTQLREAHDKPWTIVVIGPMNKLHDPKAWYAPLVSAPGLHFVHATG
jgi:hypothetical protein